jgi:excisionase family DNA binding protein
MSTSKRGGRKQRVEAAVLSEPLPVLLRPDEVAVWLGVTRKSIYNMIARGVLPSATMLKIGGSLRFDEARLREWITEKRLSSR